MNGYEPSVTQWFCIDCTCAHANGEWRPDRPDDLPEPLSAVPEGWHIASGRSFEEHSCGRENGEDVDECDCEDGGFMAVGCDGCGDGLHGDKYAHTLFIPIELTPEVDTKKMCQFDGNELYTDSLGGSWQYNVCPACGNRYTLNGVLIEHPK